MMPTPQPEMLAVDKPPRKKVVRLRSKALREVRDEQNKTNRIIPTAPFNRYVREVVRGITDEDIRFRKEALEALQTDCEDYLIGMFHDANLLAIQCGRETVDTRDVELWKTIKGVN